MNKRLKYQDHPSHFMLILARIIGFLIAGVYILFILPEFISNFDTLSYDTEFWVFLVYALSLTYGFGFLLTFWKIKAGAIIMIICSIGIAFYGFFDSMRWEVFLLLIPLSFSGIMFLMHAKKNLYTKNL
ncbi:hypothetical protein ACT3CE_05575 [Marinifilum sp. RC60d5]|uniref:hypothetical protein n=1 Tax=Marinifilum sp. RC60d5 TaxID=3458414 RepID=UPI004036B77A